MRSSATPSEASSGFDGLAAAYDRWYDTPVGRLVDRLEKDAIFTLLEPRPSPLALHPPFRPGPSALSPIIVGLDLAAEPVKTLEETRQILKPGAPLVVAILNRSGLWTLWRRFKRLFVPSVGRHARFLGLEELRRHMETHGFRQLRWRGAVHFLPIFTGRAARCLERCEAFGARWMPARATFLAMSGRRA